MGRGLPSRQTVNAVDGRVRACDVQVASLLWTLDGHRTVQTAVVGITTVKVREVAEVVTDHLTFTVSPDQLVATPDGWVHARDAEGTVLAWTPARKLCRARLTIKPGYDFGHLLGAAEGRIRLPRAGGLVLSGRSDEAVRGWGRASHAPAVSARGAPGQGDL